MRPEKELILNLIEHENITQSELARRLGKPRSNVNSCLVGNNERSMLVSELAKYIEALGYDLDFVVTKRR